MFLQFDQHAAFRSITLGASSLARFGRLAVDDRVPPLIGQGTSPGSLFARQKLVVVGQGSVGRRCSTHFARLGVRELRLIDPGRFDDPANLVTQEILASDLGQSKAVSAGTACKSISPQTRVLVYEGKLQELNPVLMAGADAVILATDNLATEVDVASRFRLLGIPLIQASVHGESLVAQVRLIENRSAQGACLICPYGPEEWRHVNQSTVFSCSAATGGSIPNVAAPPTMSTSFLCSLAADLALTQWTRFTLGLGQPVADTMLQYCGFTHRILQSPIPTNADCRCDHVVLDRKTVPSPFRQRTLRQLAEAAGYELPLPAGVSFTLGSLSYVTSAVCRCDQQTVACFMPAGAKLSRCHQCGEVRVAEPFLTHRPTPASILREQMDQPLKKIGASRVRWAVVQRGERGVLLLPTPTDPPSAVRKEPIDATATT